MMNDLAVALHVGAKHLAQKGASAEEIVAFLREAADSVRLPLSGAERTRKCREAKKAQAECNDVTLHVTNVHKKESLATVASDSSTSAKTVTKNILLGLTTQTDVTNVTKRGTTLPPDWSPPENLIEWAKAELGLTEEFLRGQTDRFRDYYGDLTGQKAVKRNWVMTWRNWMRNAKERLPKPGVPAQIQNRSKPGWQEVQSDYRQKYGAEAFKVYCEETAA
jgi:predicted pyridoxine 5'-phosphate oxidase superfamily flavin-nucleotide-binding protein